jgi:transmembrane sensor
VRLGWRARQVSLGEGQASFDVAKDVRRPFVIAVGDQRVRVVGTEFDISHFGRAIVISVRRGVVEVRQPALGGKPIARLVRGESLAHDEGAATSVTRAVDPDLAFAWTQGRLVCNDQPLPELVAYLNRRFSTPIRLSERAAKRRFTGVLMIGDENDTVRRLAAFLSLHIERSRTGIVLD